VIIVWRYRVVVQETNIYVFGDFLGLDEKK